MATDLSVQLAEKEALISALTAQLEKTVDQLDRLRRNGSDRAASIGAAAAPLAAPPPLPPELVGRLDRFLNSWEEHPTPVWAKRLDAQLEQIRDLLEQEPSASPVKSASVASRPAARGAERAAGASGTDSFWEAAKSRLLANNPPAEPSPMETIIIPPPPEPPRAAPPTVHPGDTSIHEPDAPPLPTPVEEMATRDELVEAVEVRDRYLAYLLARLRTLESQNPVRVDWDRLKDVPEELRLRLESLEATLQNQLRQSELSHALERAALTRERAKLSQIKQQLESQVRRLQSIVPEPSATESDAREPSESSNRWKRLFPRS